MLLPDSIYELKPYACMVTGVASLWIEGLLVKLCSATIFWAGWTIHKWRKGARECR